MGGAFAGLAIGLQAEAQAFQQAPDQLMADRVAALGEFSGKMALALADPQQRRLRVAAQRRLDQRQQCVRQPWIFRRRGFTAASRATHPSGHRVVTVAQLGQAAGDRATRHPGRLRRCRDPSISRRRLPRPRLIADDRARRGRGPRRESAP